MSRIALSFGAVLILGSAPAALAQDSSLQRITAPLSVEPQMTVDLPDVDAPLLQPQPVAPVDSAVANVEVLPVPVESGAPASAPESGVVVETAPEERPLPAIERVPLGQAVIGDTADDAGEQSGMGGIAQTVGALAVVIGLILILRFVFVKLSGTAGGIRSQLGAGGKAPSGVLLVLGRYPVSRGMSLVLLQLDQRVLLLSQTSAGFHTLAELSDPSEVASIIQKTRDESGESLSAKFTGMLKQFERDPETLAEMVDPAPAQPVRLRHTGTNATIESAPPVRRASGFYEDKPSVTTGEDELRSRINRLREFGS